MSRKRGTNSTQMRFELRRVIDPSRRWFVVETAPSGERAAARAFVGTGVGIWLPHFHAITVRRGRKTEVSSLFFPGYLFAALAPYQPTDLLRANKHVSDVLGNERPLCLPAPVVQAIADRLTGNTRSERLSVAAAFRIGEMRQVVQGPFAGFMATVTELLATGRIKVDVSVFARATPVELDPQYLDAA